MTKIIGTKIYDLHFSKRDFSLFYFLLSLLISFTNLDPLIFSVLFVFNLYMSKFERKIESKIFNKLNFKIPKEK